MKSSIQFRQQRVVPARWNLGRTVLLQTALAAFSFSSVIAAGGPIVSVQEALRREHFLAAEPSGVLDDTTRNALRRFQTQRKLPATGEIDSATLQALESSTDAKAIRAIPSPAAPAPPSTPRPRDTVAATDRVFLQNIDQIEAKQAVPAPTVNAVPEVAPPTAANPTPAVTPVEPTAPSEASPPIKREVAIVAPPPKLAPAKRESEEIRSSEPESRRITTVKPAKAPRERAVPAADQRPSKPATVASGPRQRVEVQSSPAPVRPVRIEESEDLRDPLEPQGVRIIRPASAPAPGRVAERDSEREPLEPQGVRIVRAPTRTTDPDGRVSERKTRTYVGRVVETVETRRAIPVEPQKKEGLFQRIFKDTDGDRDEDDD